MSSVLETTITVLSKRPQFIRFLGFWFLTVTVFIWAINLNLLLYILTGPTLTLTGKLAFIINTYANYFHYIQNPIAISSIIFSLLVAVNFTLINYLWQQTKLKTGVLKQNSGAVVSMLGAHCLSCGTSFVAPLISLFAGTSSFISAGRATASLLIATAANLIGIALISWSLVKIVRQIQTMEKTV